MGFYIELHCDTPECPHDGNEEGIPGTNRGSIKRDARAAGWLCVDGHWYCAGCVADKGWKVRTRPTRSKFSRELRAEAGSPVSVFAAAASADTHPTAGDSTEIEAPASLSGAVPEGQTPSPSPSPAAGR